MTFPPNDNDWTLLHRNDGRAFLLRTLHALEVQRGYEPVFQADLLAEVGPPSYRQYVPQNLRRLEAQHVLVRGRAGRVVLTNFGRAVLEALAAQDIVDMPALRERRTETARAQTVGRDSDPTAYRTSSADGPPDEAVYGTPELHTEGSEPTGLVEITLRRCRACYGHRMVWAAIRTQACAAGIVEEEGHGGSGVDLVLYRAANALAAQAFREWVERLTDDVPTERGDQLSARYIATESNASEFPVEGIDCELVTLYDRADDPAE